MTSPLPFGHLPREAFWVCVAGVRACVLWRTSYLCPTETALASVDASHECSFCFFSPVTPISPHKFLQLRGQGGGGGGEARQSSLTSQQLFLVPFQAPFLFSSPALFSFPGVVKKSPPPSPTPRPILVGVLPPAVTHRRGNAVMVCGGMGQLCWSHVCRWSGDVADSCPSPGYPLRAPCLQGRLSPSTRLSAAEPYVAIRPPETGRQTGAGEEEHHIPPPG